jgi:two-component system sensor histidine kinase CpxA
VLLVSSTICYLLTLLLTRPILRLREASRDISEGNLHARVPGEVEGRGDEFGDLARDFNAMAGRIENLLSSQRQLISDVSHELRSPLTRMQLAVDLMRKRGGDDPTLDRMQADLERLEHLIARLLTVARVEAGAAAAKWERIDLTGLLTDIAADAQLEAREKNCTVAFRGANACIVTGDEYLLRSALENVVRNAVYYTSPGTEVLITLVPSGEVSKMIVLEISDHGPGVPESELQNIFRPFYRVGQARDLQSGGAGLGLAIASRVIQLHRGNITASYRPTGGLQVTIQLPNPS